MGCDCTQYSHERNASPSAPSTLRSLQDFIMDCASTANAQSFAELGPRNHAVLEDLLDMGIMLGVNQTNDATLDVRHEDSQKSNIIYFTEDVFSANSTFVLAACYLASTVSDFYVCIGVGSAGRRLCYCEKETCELCKLRMEYEMTLCLNYFSRIEETLQSLEELGNQANIRVDVTSADIHNLEISLSNGSYIKIAHQMDGVYPNEMHPTAVFFHGLEQDPSNETMLSRILSNPQISTIMTSSSVISRSIYLHPSMGHVVNRYYSLIMSNRTNVNVPNSNLSCQQDEPITEGSFEFNDLLFPD